MFAMLAWMNSIAIAIVVSDLIFSICIAVGIFFGMKFLSGLIENIAVLKSAEKPEDVSRIKNALTHPIKKGKGEKVKVVMEEAEGAVSVDSLGTHSVAMKNIRSKQ